MSKIIALKKLIDKHFEKLEELVKYNNNDNDKTFYIYTTGIANSAENDVIDIWKDCRYKNIIKQIPKQFKNIVIEHYDPIMFNNNIEKEKNIKEYIQKVIEKQDNDSLTNLGIKTTQSFKKEYFDFLSFKETKKHYIIFDFAHLNNYFYNKDDNNYYMRKHKEIQEIQEIPLGEEDPEKDPEKDLDKDDIFSKSHYKEKYNFNCIYINFPSKKFTCDIYWEENIKYFSYDKKNKKIISYIELFLKALSNKTNYDYLNDILKIDINNINGQIINYYDLGNLNDFLHKIFYEKQIHIYMRNKNINNTLSDAEIDEMKKEIVPNKLYIEFFNKLFDNEIKKTLDSNDKNIFNIESYYNIDKYKIIL